MDSGRFVGSAPVVEVADTDAIAVEHPMIVMNVDNALNTFGRSRAFNRVLTSIHPEDCIPLYLSPQDPMDVPLLSQNCETNNLLLKITVPKPTGRRRKRGSRSPYVECDLSVLGLGASYHNVHDQKGSLQSYARRDSPAKLLTKMADNVERYGVEVVAKIPRTHRFRGLTDFQQSNTNAPFVSKFCDTALSGHVEKLRKFKFDMSRGWKVNEEIVPPPIFTTHTLPFNWAWRQNAVNLDLDEAIGDIVSKSPSKPGKKRCLEYIPFNAPTVPQDSPEAPRDNPELQSILSALGEAFNERQVWTRRALINRLANHPYAYLAADAFHFVAYQFRGGPFRDAIVKLGIDPRSDKKYALYQTMFFRIYHEEEKTFGMQWQDVRTGYSITKHVNNRKLHNNTHIFDGKTLTLDGKVWQLCDITEPFLVRVIKGLTLREEFEFEHDGWFCNGSWAKLKAIIKTKLVAIRTGKVPHDEAFKDALAFPDIHPGKESSRLASSVPVPDMRLTSDEIARLRIEGKIDAAGSSGLRKLPRKRRSNMFAANMQPASKRHKMAKDEPPVNMLPSQLWPEDELDPSLFVKGVPRPVSRPKGRIGSPSDFEVEESDFYESEETEDDEDERESAPQHDIEWDEDEDDIHVPGRPILERNVSNDGEGKDD